MELVRRMVQLCRLSGLSGQHRVSPLVLWILLVTSAYARAQANDTVIGFNDVPPDTPVAAQYHSLGVDFGMPPYSSLPPTRQIPAVSCCYPITRAAPAGWASQVADLSWHSQEIWQAGVFGTFTTFRQHVQVTVGDFLPGETTLVMLTAYDVNGALVAQSPAQSVTGGAQPVTLRAIAPGTTPSIAFFLVQATDMNKLIWADNLTFDNPAAPAAANFTLGNASGGNFFTIAQGDSGTETIPINRFNGSNGDITFSASGLPPGVTAVFTPNPVPGVGDSTILTLIAGPGAQPITNGTFTITADPNGNLAVGPQIRQAQLPINIYPAFEVYGFGLDAVFNVAPCTSLTLSIGVSKFSSKIGDVTLALRVPMLAGGTADLPPFIHASFNPPVSPQGSEDTTIILRISVDPDSLADIQLVVQGTSGSVVALSQPFTLLGTPSSIASVIPSSGRTPQYLQPGTQVVIDGVGFCGPLQVQFGNSQAVANPDSATSTEVRVTVPPLATTGPISLVPSPMSFISWNSIISPSAFTVDSYRNTAGFSFGNYTPHITFDELTMAFGAGQTYDEIEFCWPFDCGVSIRDPIAMIVNSIANSLFDAPGTGGACFGVALASQRLLNGQRARSDFPPPGAHNNFGLDSPDPGTGPPGNPGNGPSGPIIDYINSQLVEQLSVEMFNVFSNQKSQPLSAVYSAVHDALAAGESPVVSLVEFGTPPEGHSVVAYNLEDVGPNEFYIDVYDPNVPFLAVEDSDSSGATHNTNVTNSKIHAAPDGSWTLPSTLDSSNNSFHGANGGLLVTRASELPTQPTMIGGELASLLNGGTLVIFGSGGATDQAGQIVGTDVRASRTTQLADSNGHTLFDSNGNLNTNPATRLDATPFAPLVGKKAPTDTFLVAVNTTITQTVIGRAAAPDHHILIAPGFAARLDTAAAPGISDQIAFDPTGGINLQTADTSKPFTFGIMTRHKGLVQSAELAATTFQGAKDEFRFDQKSGAAIFHHVGAASSFRLRLSSQGSDASVLAFDSEGLQIGAGETATFLPDRWSRLSTVAMTVRDAQGHERQQLLQNRFKTEPVGRLEDLDVHGVAGQELSRQFQVTSKLEHLPVDSQVALVWSVSEKGGRTVAHQARTFSANELKTGEMNHKFVFKAPATGHYEARVDLVVVTTSGVIQSGQASSLSRGFEID